MWAFADVRPSNVDKKSNPGERAVRLVNYTDVYYNQIITSDLELMAASASDEHIERFRVLPGDIIITKDSETPDDIGIPAQVGSADDDMVCAYHLTLLRPWSGRVCSRYLYWALESNSTKGYWLTSSFGVTRYSIGSGVVSRLPIGDVDLDTQRAIADYLDRETGEIDAMIEKMDELAETLRVRCTGVASSLYLRGYERVKLKWVISEVDERAGSQNQGLPLLSVSIHQGVQSREESTSNQKASLDLGKYKVARHGQIALNRMRAFQGGLGRVFMDGLVSPDYAVLEANDRLSTVWAEYVMRTPEFIALMTQRLRGIGAADQSNVRTPRINVSDLVELTIPLPERREQERVIVELDEITGRIDAMLAKVAKLKSLLIERRAALITDVVTGRKKVA